MRRSIAKKQTKNCPPDNENRLVAKLRRADLPPALQSARLSVGIGDDTAVWRPRPGYETLLTCDWFLERSHFLLDRHPADAVGWKCLARAVSDIAAMGGEPRCFLLSLALPKPQTGRWLDRFIKGLKSASRSLKCPVAGGDTTLRDQVLINITVVGECRRGLAVLRSGARPGHAIFVSGRLGEAEYGLQRIRASKGKLSARDPLLRKHLYPKPQLALGAWLSSRKLASAMMDLSDGLSMDLPRLCAASGVGAQLEAHRIPCVRLAKSGREKFDPLALALHGGDDYELLFTVPPQKVSRIPRRLAGVDLTLVGHIIPDNRILLIDKNGRSKALNEKGWDPFRA